MNTSELSPYLVRTERAQDIYMDQCLTSQNGMATGGLVDWRGKPINRKVHGGVRAAWFLYCKSLRTWIPHDSLLTFYSVSNYMFIILICQYFFRIIMLRLYLDPWD